jgi:DNA polymerase III subunit beta
MESTPHDATAALFSTPSSAPGTPAAHHSGFRCQILREHLLPALTLMQAIAEPHPSLPILSHVFLEARPHDALELRATDLEIGLSRHCPASVDTAGACTADARRLYEIVRALPPGSLTLESTLAHGLTITQDKRRFRLPGLEPNEFPHLAPAGESVQTLELPAAQLKELLDRTSFAVSPDDTRMNLHSLLFACGPDDQVCCVASDGHRLAIVARPVPGAPTAVAPTLLPAQGLTEARRLLELVKDDTVTMTVGRAVTVLTVGSTTLSLRLVGGEFPDYEQVIPRTHARRLAIPRAALVAALRRVMVLTTERARGVKCDIHAGTLTLSVNTPDLGEGSEELAIDYQGPGLTVGFNGRYLLDFCTAVEAAVQVVMELANDTTPALLRIEDDPQYRYVLMPMRIF